MTKRILTHVSAFFFARGPVLLHRGAIKVNRPARGARSGHGEMARPCQACAQADEGQGLHPRHASLQVKSKKGVLFGGISFIKYLRVKFYVTDPSRLQEEYTRYHVYLQVGNTRKDENYNTKTDFESPATTTT